MVRFLKLKKRRTSLSEMFGMGTYKLVKIADIAGAVTAYCCTGKSGSRIYRNFSTADFVIPGEKK
jgi:hypothetical protein